MLGWVALGVLAILVPIFYLLQHSPGSQPRPLPSAQKVAKEKTNVLLVVAHPDDESMFFGPTLLSLAQLGTYDIRTFCLSTGNADGLGDLRKLEMVAACSVLKVPAEKVDVVDHPALQDGFSSSWDQSLIVKLLRETVTAHNTHIVLTFDSYGVSGHPNHRAVNLGVRAFLLEQGKEMKSRDGPMQEPVRGWELVSTSTVRKYCGALEVCAPLLDWGCQKKLHRFVNPSPWTSIVAMSRHHSQWVWYRRLFVLFSRYTYINTLKMMDN